jgi:hypothetical protein
MRRLGKTCLALLLLAGALSACTADDLDCSLGAMKATCAPGTVGFNRMEAQLQTAQRACLKKGLEPGGDAYAACLAAAGPLRTPARTAPLDRIGPGATP